MRPSGPCEIFPLAEILMEMPPDDELTVLTGEPLNQCATPYSSSRASDFRALLLN
jgi:hypothetical protein